MIVYNITTNVDREIHEHWLLWYREIHIPEIMETGLFERFTLLKILDLETTDDITYALQLFSSDRERYQEYIDRYAPGLRKKAVEQWADRTIAFRTLMEVIN